MKARALVILAVTVCAVGAALAQTYSTCFEGEFTYLADLRGANYGLKHGDILKASMVRNVISVSINGVEKARVTDDTYKAGDPGIGSFLRADGGRDVGSNTNFGFASFSAKGLGGSTDPQPSFPRLMGMNIGAKNYDNPEYQKQLARLDVVILGFYKGWKPRYGMAKVVQNLKALSGGKILLGQYTILNECGDDPKNAANLDVQGKLNEMNWWARKSDGSRVQWTAQYRSRSWDINFTSGSRPDAHGQRFPEWLAERDDEVFFKPVRFDLWYCDNVFAKPRVTADWDGNGTDDSPKDPIVAAAYRAGHRAEWDHIRKIHPGLLLMGNVDGDLSESEYAGQLEGAFLEGLMGKSWSIENWGGWASMMQRYHAVMAKTRAPHWVGFNVHGQTNDYRFFRYAYTSCLLDDGCFCFTDAKKEYSSVAWFDEFDFRLGAALSKPPVNAWTTAFGGASSSTALLW